MTPPVAPKNATWLDIFLIKFRGKTVWFGFVDRALLACARMDGWLDVYAFLDMGRIRGIVGFFWGPLKRDIMV